MGTHPIFESDFDCLTECPASPSLAQPAWTPIVPDWPVIPETIKKIAAAATGAGRPPLIAPQSLGSWQPVGEPDRIEVVRIGINLLKRKPISEEEMDAINTGSAY